MTTLAEVKMSCGVCGEVSPQYVVSSTSSFGAPDLDLRPPPLARHIVHATVLRCRVCGYCAPDLSVARPNLRSLVADECYRRLLEEDGLPEPARNWRCHAYLLGTAGDHAAAGSAYLSAAWICDDNDLAEPALLCRNAALAEWDLASAAGQRFAQATHTEDAIRIDVLRRARRFEDARRECDRALSERVPAVVLSVLHMEQSLIDSEDDRCHSLAEIET